MQTGILQFPNAISMEITLIVAWVEAMLLSKPNGKVFKKNRRQRTS